MFNEYGRWYNLLIIFFFYWMDVYLYIEDLRKAFFLKMKLCTMVNVLIDCCIYENKLYK